MIPDSDRPVLLRAARDAIAAHVSGIRLPAPGVAGGAFERRAGVFVTIHVAEALRGCVGHVEPDEALGLLVPRMAVAACSADPRFPPVGLVELPRLHLEISILGALERVTAPEQVVIGRDGLVIEHGVQRGLLLPRVALDRNWDRERFLAQTCRKAHLPSNSWKNGATVWRFEVEVVREPGAPAVTR